MVIDRLFDDCYALSQKYETNLICVLEKFTDVELSYKRLMTDVPYEVLIKRTEEYFSNKLKSDTNE